MAKNRIKNLCSGGVGGCGDSWLLAEELSKSVGADRFKNRVEPTPMVVPANEELKRMPPVIEQFDPLDPLNPLSPIHVR